ncbi:MAG TPA: hypothetical protein VHG91_11875, partial [Longimicrobium sp.]|nr:hypothetical protein [Longimicrobium sp.]
PVTALVSRWKTGGDDPADDIADLTAAARELVGAADDPDRLARYQHLLQEGKHDLARRGDAPADRGRLATAETLLAVACSLAQGRSGAGDRDIAALTSLVRTRTHAEKVLRALSLGVTRFADLRERTGLLDTQLDRVLKWSVPAGLVSRGGTRRDVRYRLTPLGELAIGSVEEPAWLRAAAAVVRCAVEARTVRGSLDDAAAEAAELAALPETQARHAVSAFLSALDPAPASHLAHALRVSAAAERRVAFFPWMSVPSGGGFEWWKRAHAAAASQALVARALERAGVPPEALEEWVPPEPSFGGLQPERVRLDRPTVVVGVDHPVTDPLLEAFGVSLSGNRPFTSACAPEVAAARENGHGVVVRLYNPETGVSHLVVGGWTPESSRAAARWFYDDAERLVGDFRRVSSAAVVPADPAAAPAFRGVLETVPRRDEIEVALSRSDPLSIGRIEVRVHREPEAGVEILAVPEPVVVAEPTYRRVGGRPNKQPQRRDDSDELAPRRHVPSYSFRPGGKKLAADDRHTEHGPGMTDPTRGEPMK